MIILNYTINNTIKYNTIKLRLNGGKLTLMIIIIILNYTINNTNLQVLIRLNRYKKNSITGSKNQPSRYH